MSRCFPYPPPGFIGKKASDVSTLIDSIKANKHKRREKKQIVYTKQKRKRVDTQGSSVTEEHGQPLNLQNPSYSSDATQNSPSAATHGNIIRITLPLQKYKESASKISKELLPSDVPCCTSGRNDEQIRSGFVHPVTSASQGDAKNNSSHSCPSKELLCSTSGNARQTQTSSGDKKTRKKISNYNHHLIQILYQIALPTEVDGDDWLFGPKSSNKRNVEKQLPLDTSSASSALYLEEAKIYALPYTLPF